MNQIEKIFAAEKLPLRRLVPLAPLSTFGVGGRAEYFLTVTRASSLARVWRLAHALGLNTRLLAGGSNVVFGDGVVRGLIVHFAPKESPHHRQGLSLTLTCEANLPLASLIKAAIDRGLAGLETLSGIPGTVGGAIVGNAGAYGQCISDHLTRVQVFNPLLGGGRGGVEWLNADACHFAYRESIFKHKDWLVLGAEFKLSRADKKQLSARAREIIKIREKKYTPGLHCPGSFFKNVLVAGLPRAVLGKLDRKKIIDGKIPAGYLLEEVGARGLRAGRLEVASFHGNLLINRGRATCREVRALAAKLRRRVKAKFGIILEEEVRYLC